MDTDTIIIGLVGETGSGKDTVANHIHKRFGLPLRRFARPLKKTLSFFLEKPSKADHSWLYDVLKERFGENVLHNALRKEIYNLNAKAIVVNGLRMPKDEEFIRSFDHNYIIYVTADQKLRWERTRGRGEKTDDDQPFEAFQEFEATAETERAVAGIGARADFTIQNATSLDDLLTQVNTVMEEILTPKK